ncbi:endonuclease 4 isoform X1 [Cryptomeria japonica]|uniref:endonuclease 4 isoform X1 n=1 Tax=Cryptomeria japonica TaxID=3369 RepID=UPI0027DA272C|nr:endonuclease 4 isoform X1 [Cryptomeria japonica]
MDRFRFFLTWSVVISMDSALPGALCWGKEGHYATCKIAEALLSKAAADAVQQLLPDYAEGDLASLCSWPDEIKFWHKYHWSSPLHYIDTPDFRCNYDYSRDCHNAQGERDMCVAGAINNYTSQLTTYGTLSDERYNLTEALLFLSHFMGDIHQPLHVGFTGDLGGNTIIVRWYRRKANLHHVWDNMIIETAVKDFYGSNLTLMIQGIQANISDIWSNDVSTWERCSTNKNASPNPYAVESIGLACKWAYRNATPGTILSDDYFLSRLPIVEKQLAKGAVRLAATLNHIFSSKMVDRQIAII